MDRRCLPLLFLLPLASCRLEGKSPTHPESTQAVATNRAGPNQPKSKESASAIAEPVATEQDRAAGPSGPEPARARLRGAHERALAWLAAHQRDDGAWGGEKDASVNTIGLTGLALLALQSDGSTMASGSHARAIALGVQYLISKQDATSGLVGERVGHSFAYDHAIATQALCRALATTPSDRLREVCTEAVGFISRMRNPYGAWRYDYPPTGESDTSVTGWMVEALIAAREAGLSIDEGALVSAVAWIDDVTDPETARVGYDTRGSSSSRITGLNDQFPTDKHEAMTASGMVTRWNAGQRADTTPMLKRHAELLRKRLPEWDLAGNTIDEYYWYFGSLATRRMGGVDAKAWREALSRALVDSQYSGGEQKGSWEPAGPWAYSGGHVYATSLNALSIAMVL